MIEVKGPGEIDFFGAKNAVDYLRMPERVNEMSDRLEVMSCDMIEIKATLEQLVAIIDKSIEKRPFETVIKSLEDKQ